ncbi:MAG: isoprenoid biosynthesis glyoxalase ElbB [Candidatus Sumerlaeaceae bacterium]|nr:isoprenoid biosynthesis glyoxalase ElbB [Candidatus Sumerlaeaceae bacterium]
MAKKVAVLLSGCGVFDGSEIHEAVLTLLALDNAGAEAVCCAPNVDQMHVINHLTHQPVNEKRNVLVESARIARGKIKDLAEIRAADFDALFLPGGYGAAKNLCTFATDGPNAIIHPEVARVVRDFAAARKPIGAVCIAPATLAAVFKGTDIKPAVTIGTDEATASGLRAMGAEHVSCGVKDFHVDKANRIVTSPAYMLGRSIGEVFVGIEKTVRAVLDLC